MGKKTANGSKLRWTATERATAKRATLHADFHLRKEIAAKNAGIRPDWLVARDGVQSQYIKGDRAVFPRRTMTVKERRMNTRKRYQRKQENPVIRDARHAPPDYEHYVSPDVLSGVDNGR